MKVGFLVARCVTGVPLSDPMGDPSRSNPATLLSGAPRLALPCSAVAPAQARRWLRGLLHEGASVLPGTGAESVGDGAELLLTEVVTNAVVHARTESLVTAQLETDRLWAVVKDWSPLLPVAPAPAPVDLGLAAVPTAGRGLGLLEELASSWGWQRAGAGKVVWFALDYPCPPPGP